MSKELVISTSPHETRVAILEKGNLVEIYVEREKEYALVGSIYKGRVTRVLPGMQSAFVEIGLDSDAFLYVSDVLEEIEEYDQIVSTVEEKVAKMEEQGGHVFSASPEQGSAEPPEVTGEEEPVPSAPSTDAAPPSAPSSLPAGGYRQDNFGNKEPRDGGYRRGGGQGAYQGGRGGQGGGFDRPREGGGQGGGFGRPREGGGYGRGGPRQGRGGNRGRFRGRGPGGGRDDRSLPSSKYVSP